MNVKNYAVLNEDVEYKLQGHGSKEWVNKEIYDENKILLDWNEEMNKELHSLWE